MEYDNFGVHLKSFNDWCANNFLDVRRLGSNLFECGGKKYLLLSEKDGDVFDADMHFILNSVEEDVLKDADAVVYKWGTRYCYTLKENMNSPESGNVKDFRYLGGPKVITPNCPFLGIHGHYELLNGTRPYSDWITKAKWLKTAILGICEKNTLAGTLAFQMECEKEGIKSVLGETITISLGKEFFIEGKIYALTEQGWKNVLLINSEINVKNPSRFVDADRLCELGEGVAFVFDTLYPYKEDFVRKVQKNFSLCYYKLDSVRWENPKTDKSFLKNTQDYINNGLGIKPIFISDAYYLEPDDYEVKRDLNKIAGVKNNLSRNQYFKSDDELLSVFGDVFEDKGFGDVVGTAMDSLTELTDAVVYKIETGRFKLPEYLLNPQERVLYGTSDKEFDALIMEGWKARKIDEKPNVEEYLDRLEEEISVIREGGFVDYFLILYDIFRWCRQNNVLTGIGRGSAAGCLCSYLLNITQVDPLEYGLLFERFMNRGRIKQSFPDVDSDIESNRRDDVKRYMESKYGDNRVCSLGTYTTLQLKASLRDFSRVNNVSLGTAEYISRMLSAEAVARAPYEYLFKMMGKSEPLYKFVQDHSPMIEEMRLCHAAPRSASVHACACLILPQAESIYTSIPIRKTEMDGNEMIVSEWEGPYIEGAGYLKEDILGILQLDKFRMMIDLIKEHYGTDIDIYNIPLYDNEVYEMISEGKTGDLFQLGSRGLTTYCTQAKPSSLQELCAIVALYRPGPMDNGFHNEYVQLKNGQRKVEYGSGLEEITKETFGLLVYQEQIMKITTDIAGFTLQEADDIRKGMGKKKMKYLDEKMSKFVEGGVKNGYEKGYLEELWKKMVQFGKYSFNKCLDGDTKLYRPCTGKSRFLPTIAEMYRIKNDSDYARQTGHFQLHRKYGRLGYGLCWSLNEENKLIKNRIKDIYYQGCREVYCITLESGKQITCTDNHKFPTESGKRMLKDLRVGDSLFVSSGWQSKVELPTHSEKIVSIEYAGVKEVYDVEMEHPYHTLTIDNGIVTSNSHSLCYAQTGYICGYIKYHYPLPYWITALEFANDDNLSRFISEINYEDGITLSTPDINKSGRKFYADFDLKKIFWSISRVKQCGEVAVNSIFEEREKNGPFFDLKEFVFRVNKSKVNKSVVENLILAGAFDDMCDVKTPADRLGVIKEYRDIAQVKIDPKKHDWLADVRQEDWWWLMQQKRVCGLAVFDYPSIVWSNGYDMDKFLSLKDFEFEDLSRSRGGSRMVVTSGIAVNVEFKNSKKGDFCRFQLEQNYSYVWVTVWNDNFYEWENVLEQIEGKILVVKARAYHDAFKSENALQSDKGFEIKIVE